MQQHQNREQLPLDRICLGNCRELLSSLADECVDLGVSSPPYNLGKEYEAKQALNIYLEEQKTQPRRTNNTSLSISRRLDSENCIGYNRKR